MVTAGSVQAEGRRARILAMLAEEGAIQLDATAAALGVSPMTVRRDLDELEAAGLLRRVRGGAVLVTGPQPFSARRATHARAKDVIASKALAYVPADGSIAIDASTTTGTLAAQLRDHAGLTVVTNSYENFSAMRTTRGVRSILVGGEEEQTTGSLVGPLAYQSALSMYYRAFFTSAAAVDTEGTSEVSLSESHAKQAFADRAERVVLCVDSSKLGKRSLATAFGFERIAVVITELDPDDPRLAEYRELAEFV
jgi:DeoR/GlpR family transcriptional regulator of sugar metabolism